MKKIIFILFVLPMAVMAQFSANIGSPLGIMDGGIMGMGAPMQMENPVTWSSEVSEDEDSKVKICLKANIQEGWHLYSQHQNGTGLPLKLGCIESLTPNSSLLTPNFKWSEAPSYTEVFEPIL